MNRRDFITLLSRRGDCVAARGARAAAHEAGGRILAEHITR